MGTPADLHCRPYVSLGQPRPRSCEAQVPAGEAVQSRGQRVSGHPLAFLFPGPHLEFAFRHSHLNVLLLSVCLFLLFKKGTSETGPLSV